MGKILAKNIRGMSLRTKICIVLMLLIGSFLYQSILKPMIGDSATNTYYFTTASSVNVGTDGTTSTYPRVGGKILMNTGVYTTSRSVTASSITTEQRMISVYGPSNYATKQTLTAPAVTIGARDRNGTTNAITWKAYVYDYNPTVAPGTIDNKGAASNTALIWTSDAIEAHPSVQTPIPITFTSQPPYDIPVGHRLKLVITCQMASTASSALLYWGGSTNYSFFTYSETPYVANSLTVNNLTDYYSGALTTVTQGDSNVPMLEFDMYSNVAGGASWTGGKLDKIGTNTSSYLNPDEPGDVSFSIYKDADGDGVFEATDTLVGGPYNFTQLTANAYTLSTAQTITATPAHYFIVFNILKNSTYNTTVGMRIADSTYFTVTGAAGGVQNVISTSSSTPNIQYGGTEITKEYAADWNTGTSLAGIAESGGPSSTDTACITRNTNVSPTYLPLPLVGLLNYPAHSCASVAGQGYANNTGSTQANFLTLYFGGTGYPSIMKTVKGSFFTYRLYAPSGGGTVTLQLFYVTSGGTRVNAPIKSTYKTTGSISQTVTTTLAGQDFSNVPAGARLGIQIGVTANCNIGLGSSVGAKLTMLETAAENENVDVGNGTSIPNATVYASDTVYNPINGSSLSGTPIVIDSFTLSASKAKTVNSITIQGNTLFNSTNVKQVSIYTDSSTVGTLGIVDGTDTLVGSTTTISSNSATISGLSLAVTTSVKRYLVVVSIGDTPNTNVVLTALVSGLTVATTGGMGENSDSASGTLTILPTTTLTDYITAEPPSVIIPWNAGATKVDAFGLNTNGGVNDTITDITVILTTTSSLPAGKVISDYVGRVDILNGAGVSLGHLTSPTQANNWQVSTLGLAATATPTEYFVAITPKGNQNITFNVKATVTALSHSRTTNKLVLSDAASATIIMDQQPPTEATLTAGTGTYHNDTDRAEINLSWSASTDASGSAVSYILVRGPGSAPPPRSCAVDGVNIFSVYQGTNTTFTNLGLDEGVSYGYRVCVKDSVNNISFGTAGNAVASIKNRCTELPQLTVNPTASFVKAGNSVKLPVSIINMDTGVCAATTFTLSIVGTDVDDNNFTVSTFDGNGFIIATNRGSQFTNLNITAKPGAAEKAVKTFTVKVTKSSGGATTALNPVYVMVNKYGTMIHSSLQVGTKYGNWGLDYTCGTCHSPSSTNSTNIKQVKSVITTPNGNRQTAFSIVSTTTGAGVAGVFGNDYRAGTISTNVCEVCHHNTRYHQYSASKVAWKDHNNNRDCMQCHPHSLGFKTVSIAGSCNDCHGNPPTTQVQLVSPTTDVLFPYATNAGSHDKHNARQVKCAACHSNANHLISAVPDKKLNMGFKIRSSNFTGFKGNLSSGTLRSLPPDNGYVYLGAAGLSIQQAPNTIMTCSVYCHGWNGDGGYNSQPAWTGINQVGCGSCHAASASDPPTSGSHHKHTSNQPGYGNGIACQTCHGYRNYSTSSAHINGNVEWDLSTITPIALYRGLNKGSTGNVAPTAPGNYGTCSNLYCHSNVQSNNGTGPPTLFGTPVWGGTTTCGSCHIDPNTTGGHSQHTTAGDSSFDCRICHGSGGDANPLNHGNGRIDFAFSGLGENTHYSYSSSKIPGSGAYGTCSNSNCHGRKSIQWGPSTATPLCDKCHATSAISGGFYGTAGPGSTTLKTDPYVGAHFQHITSMPFKYSAKVNCNYCHLLPTGPYSPGHIDTPLPAEINYGTLADSGLQGTFTSAAHAPVYNYTTKQCTNLWCHGAGMSSNEGLNNYGSVIYDGGTLGSPAPAVWNSPFLTGVGANDCVKCHAFPPAAPLPGYTHYNSDKGRPYIATECITCHNHVDSTGYGFTRPELHVNGVVNSCLTCHGRPPVDEAGLTVPLIGALDPGFGGAHEAHFLNPNINSDCGACHYNYSPTMPSYQLEIGFKAYSGRVTRGTFYGYSTLPSTGYSQPIVYFATRSSTKVRRTNNKTTVNTCTNLYCHGGGTATLPPLGGGSNIKPSWVGGSSQAACGSCHGVTGDTYKTSGSHGAHVGTAFGDPHIDCVNCHGIKENNYHVNGKVEWEFYSTALRLNQTAGYSNSGYMPPGSSSYTASGFVDNLAPSASYGTCQVYCHSDVYDKSYKVPTWGGAPMTCDSCHRNQTSSGRFTGTHQKHTASSANGGYAIECAVCHYGSGAGNPLHINGSVDVIFNSTIVGMAGVYDKPTKQCFNILCHVSTTSDGPTWGTTDGNYDTGTHKPTCIGCHSSNIGSRAAVIPMFGGQSHHVQGVQIGNGVCYQCHMEGNADGTANTTYHTRTSNQPVDLVIWGAGARGTAFTSYTANGSTTVSRKSLEYSKINNHCLGCHNLQNSTTTPINPFGDGKNPKSYAWDGKSIAERYSQAGTTSWSSYVDGTSTDISPKSTQTKAFSAHGRADLNKRGWNTSETWPDTSGNNATTSIVRCYDCHNSHGTAASGIMSSYSSFTGRYKGGILKSTENGIGGYTADYTPLAGGDAAAPNKNAYNPGASLCFDCHNNANASTTVPWGYSGTFGATQAIYGYNDTPNFGNGTFGTVTRFGTTYKGFSSATVNVRSNKGGHFGASSALTTTITQRAFDVTPQAGMTAIMGLCTPCHDPHGVSPTLTQANAVPLLKGTWVTSPYKEDAAPANTNEARGGSSKGPAALAVGSTPGYHIDQNTLGTMANGKPSKLQNYPALSGANALQTIADTNFAGLCTGCHAKTQLVYPNTTSASTGNWKKMRRVHMTVKGWASTAGSGGNKSSAIHAYTCSKCHTPHNYRLPRLLVTNCLDVKHRGRVASGATLPPVRSASGSKGSGTGRFPGGGGGTTGQSSATNPGPWFFGTSGATQTCHDDAQAGGTTYNANSELWNTKSPW